MLSLDSDETLNGPLNKLIQDQLDGKDCSILKKDIDDINRVIDSKSKKKDKTLSKTKSKSDDCDIIKLEKSIKDNNEAVKSLKKKRNECISEKAKYKNNMSLRDLQNLILKENKPNVREFLNLFVTTQERSSGVKMTRNHVFEALWILSYLNRVDDLSDKRNRQFYKSLEKQETQTNDEVLNGNVNSSSGGGIADIYFEMDKGFSDKQIDKTNCNNKDVSIPHCENEPIEVYSRYLFSSKLYSKEKGAPKYDIQDIMVEANNKFGKTGYNIILLVNDKDILQKRLDRTDKIIGKSVHKILDMNDLDIYYKKLLYYLQNKSPQEIEKITESLQPRLHQQYFIDYTKECIEKKSKKFVWGAVPRSGKSFMIGGLISDIKSKYVFLILGAITETKDQFIKMFKDYDTSFGEYSIHDLQNKKIYNEGKSKHIFICSQEKIRMDNKKDKLEPHILKILKEEKDKLIFFDEIHQGSGEQSMQGDMLQNLVFDNDYKAFIMVTATFAKPYLKYMNKGDEDTKLLQWRYDDIQLMKDINKSITDEESGEKKYETYNEFLEKLKGEQDGDFKSHIFQKVINDQLKQGKTYGNIASEYKIYPELVVSTPIISDIPEQYNSLIIDKDININGIFKPLTKKTISETNTCDKFIQYLFEEIYTKLLLRRLKYDVRNPHSEIWFLPTMLRDKDKDKEIDMSPFRNLTQNLVIRLMTNRFFRDNYCFIILHSVGFGNDKIDFINMPISEGGQTITWSKADVNKTSRYGCISTNPTSSDCKKGVKNCVLEQEACAKTHGKSVIILTGKMLRLGVSLPCVDIALHMDPIKSVDTIYQSMFRVLTERKGKTQGIFIDLLTTRQISFMYDYTNYSNDKQLLGTEKKMKKLLENLLLFNFDGISNTQGSEYQQLYDKLMEQFSLNNPELFKINSQKIDLSKVSELLQDDRLSDLILPFSELLNKLDINYSVVKGNKEKKILVKRKGNELKDEYEIEKLEKPELKKIPKELKDKYEEVSNFLNDCIMLFAIFKDNYNITFTRGNKKQSEDLKKEILDFFSQDIEDIVELCDGNDVDDDKIINCHLYNILRSPKIDLKELTKRFSELKSALKGIFNIILEKDDFFNIYVNCIEEMKKVKNDAQQLKNKEPCAEDFIKDEKVLEIIRKRLSVREEEKNLYGEVFTPVELICEMFDHLPKDVWTNPNLKWLDPANGIGNFPVVAYYKLFDSLKSKIPDNAKRSKHIIENMLYMVELNPVNVRVCKKIFNMIDDKATPNIVKHDFLTFKGFKGIDKFDVIMGNPPFGKKKLENNSTTPKLWPLFVEKSLELLKDNMFLGFIHPQNWRSPDHKFNKLKNYNMIYLHIYGPEETTKLFNVSSKVDLYVLNKSKNSKNTEIIDEKKNKISIKIGDLKFIPNYNIKEIISIINKSDKQLDIIMDGVYGSTKTKEIETPKFKYKVIKSIIKGGKLQFRYSDSNKHGHFDIPKVIVNCGRYPYPYNDYKGEYGMTQNLFGIPIKSKKEGDLIVEAINSDKFQEIIKATKWTGYGIDSKLFKYFKPDFYKQFLSKKQTKEPDNQPRKNPSPAVTPPVEPPKKQVKSVCSKAHPQGPPCETGSSPKPPKNCCYKNKSSKKGAKVKTFKKKKYINKKIKRTKRKRR